MEKEKTFEEYFKEVCNHLEDYGWDRKPDVLRVRENYDIGEDSLTCASYIDADWSDEWDDDEELDDEYWED